MCGKKFQIYGASRKFIESRHSYSCPSSLKTHPTNCCHHILSKRKLLIPPGSVFLEICFSQKPKEVDETMICFFKIRSENIKMTWDIRLFISSMTSNFFKCDSFTVL